MSANVSTPWGQARLVDQIELPQEADGRTFASLVQVLESAGGERLVRFAYTTGGAVRRGPVTLRPGDLERLREGLRTRRAVAQALGLRAR